MVIVISSSYAVPMRNWDLIRVFLAVSERGSLLGASRELGMSPPTIARHLTRLEDELGLTLFIRRHDGYRLTREGRQLLPKARQVARSVGIFSRTANDAKNPERKRVRLASGFWFSRLITAELSSFHANNPDIELDLVTGHEIADLSEGEADISIRNIRPENGALVMRKLGETLYAIYGSKAYVARNPAARDEERFESCDWIGAAEPLSSLASQVWLQEKGVRIPKLRCSHTLQFLDAAIAGVGLAILPRIIGDKEESLVCVSESIELTSKEVWLIVHERSRDVPEIRTVINWLVPLFKQITG